MHVEDRLKMVLKNRFKGSNCAPRPAVSDCCPIEVIPVGEGSHSTVTNSSTSSCNNGRKPITGQKQPGRHRVSKHSPAEVPAVLRNGRLAPHNLAMLLTACIDTSS